MDQKKIVKILTIVAISAVALLSLLIALKRNNNDYIVEKDGNIIYKNLNPLEKNIIEILSKYEVPRDKENLEISLLIETGIREVKAVVPRGRPMEEIIFSLHTATKGTKYTLVDSYLNEKKEKAELVFKSKKKNREDIIVRLKRGKNYASYIADLSIVITDLEGISTKDRTAFLTFDSGQLNYVLDAWDKELDSSYSVLSRYNKPILIALPLESKLHKENVKSQFTIYLDDSPELIKRKMENLLRHTPNIQGIATVGGSRVLSASSTVEPFFKQLKRYSLLFFDRRADANTNTKAKEYAHAEGVPYIVENSLSKAKKADDIEKELKKAASKAARYGRASIWFKASGELISEIKELAPYFEKRGIKLSSVKKCYR